MGMTREEVEEFIPTFEHFQQMVCGSCTGNDWYCPSLCADLEKAKKMKFERIQAAYQRNDGMIHKVMRYIRYAR